MSALAGFAEIQILRDSLRSLAETIDQQKRMITAAQNPIEHAQANLATAYSGDSFGGGIGFVARKINETLGFTTPLVDVQRQIQTVQGQNDLYDRQLGRTGTSDQYRTQELLTRIPQLHQIASKQAETTSILAYSGADSQAIDKFAKQKSDIDYERKELDDKYGVYDAKSFWKGDKLHRKPTEAYYKWAEGKDERQLNADKMAQAIKERDEDRGHAKNLFEERKKQAADLAKTEAVERINANQDVVASKALEAGAGGADVAFAESQKAAMRTQEEQQRLGKSLPEQTQALAAKQTQEKLQREREITQQTKSITSEGQEAVLQTEGRFYDARREAFERAAQERLLAVRELGQGEIDATKKTIKEQQDLMEKEIAHEIQTRKEASQLVVQQSGDRAQEDTLRSNGASYAADEQAYKASWDRKIQTAQNAVNAERDPIERANRQKELDALQTERKTDQARREYLKPGGQRDLAIRQERIDDTKLQAQGQDQTERLKEIKDKANRDFNDARDNPELQKSIRKQEAADIEKQEFDIKRQSLFQMGRSSRHSFEMGADSMKPLEDLGKVVSEGNKILASIDTYLRQQVAKTTP